MIKLICANTFPKSLPSAGEISHWLQNSSFPSDCWHPPEPVWKSSFPPAFIQLLNLASFQFIYPTSWDMWFVGMSTMIKSVSPKGNQPWIFTGRVDAEAEAPVLWPPDAKSWLIWKDPDAGKDWRQKEKRETGLDGWVASPTWWTWVWANFGRWWRTGKPGVLQATGSQSQTWLSGWTTTGRAMKFGEWDQHHEASPLLCPSDHPTSSTEAAGSRMTARDSRTWGCACAWDIPVGSPAQCTRLAPSGPTDLREGIALPEAVPLEFVFLPWFQLRAQHWSETPQASTSSPRWPPESSPSRESTGHQQILRLQDGSGTEMCKESAHAKPLLSI